MAPKNDKTLFANLATFAVGTLAAGALVAVPVKAFADDHAGAKHAESDKKCASAKGHEHTGDKTCSPTADAHHDGHETPAADAAATATPGADKKCSGDKACGASTSKGH